MLLRILTFFKWVYGNPLTFLVGIRRIPAYHVDYTTGHRPNRVYAFTTHQLQVERRESHRANLVYALTTHQLQAERRESHRANQVYALTTHQLQVERRESHRDNHHTPATGGEERES